MRNKFRVIATRLTMLASDESGMSTVEYAIGTIVICLPGAHRGTFGLGSLV